MSERRERPDSGDTEDNAKNERNVSQKHGKKEDATREAVEEEEATGGGAIKNNVKNERDRS